MGRGGRFPFIANANRADERRRRGYALLEYLPQAFRLADDDPAFRRHQNLRQCRMIAACLGDAGYIVDVGNRRDREFRPRREYDLIVSERPDWEGIDRAFRRDAIRVFLATSMNHRVHNANLRRRHERLAERRGCAVQFRRTYYESIPALADYDALAGPGNEFTLGTWQEIFTRPAYAYNNSWFRPAVAAPVEAKNFAEARRCFLYFASGSQVQKGLDLLLEIFPRRPDLHLYVCSRFPDEPDFCACYRQELFETPNVHPVGWTLVYGPEYQELVARCAYVILPTCSEGQSGSVVQGMYSGLIPLLTSQAGIDATGFGLTFADDSLDAITQTVVEASRRPPDWHRQRSLETRQVAEAHYSEDAFVARWRRILVDITGQAG